ncbi:YIP1 family protein [Brevundimonas sp.]|uniref:YIP1 family protein n=1 Tax=Brevundimonas sp. TaxID=1871086 RepID=UPI0028A8782F|nr:YIP1 family protein [Brevundimonas sp.]
MTAPNPPAIDPGLVARVQNILMRPRLEWPVIEAEYATTRSLFARYAMLLAAIGPVAGLIGGQLFPISIFGSVMRTPMVGGLLGAIITWGLSLLSVFVLGLIIDALAPSFNGTKDKVQAMKVAVYSMTAAWVASIFNLFPALAWLGGLLGLYGFYLLYLGLPVLMKTSPDKALGYTIVVVVAAIVLWMVVSAIAAGVVASFVVGTIGLGALALS